MKAALFWIYIVTVYCCGVWVSNCTETPLNTFIASSLGILLAWIGTEYAKKVSS